MDNQQEVVVRDKERLVAALCMLYVVVCCVIREMHLMEGKETGCVSYLVVDLN